MLRTTGWEFAIFVQSNATLPECKKKIEPILYACQYDVQRGTAGHRTYALSDSYQLRRERAGNMGWLRVITIALAFCAISTLAQNSTLSAKSAKTVLEEYWRTETNGGRLTSEGWHRANSFYVHPIPPPHNKVIVVIDNDSSVWDPWMKGNTATVIVGIESLGNIDSKLRWTPPNTSAVKEGVMYNLVLTDKHWDFESDGTTVKEVTGAPEWRINDTPGAVVYLNLDKAIAYVKKLRDQSTAPTIRKNANKTLAILNRYRPKS
jgi:hypothetical protein